MEDAASLTSVIEADTVVTVIVTLAAAWLAFSWARRRDARLRMVDIAIDLFCGEFSEKRTRTLLAMSRLSPEELGRTAMRDVPFNAELRQSSIDLMNRHEFNCYLYNAGYVDRHIFETFLMDTIIADQDALAGFRDCLHEDYKARKVPDERPFYPEVRKMRNGES